MEKEKERERETEKVCLSMVIMIVSIVRHLRAYKLFSETKI